MFGSSIPQELQELESYLENDTWEANVTYKRASRILQTAKGELCDLRGTQDLDEASRKRLELLEAAIGAFVTEGSGGWSIEGRGQLIKEASSRSKLAFVALGSVRFAECRAERRVKDRKIRLVSGVHGAKENSFWPTTLINNGELREHLGFDSEQNAKYFALFENAMSQIKVGSKEEFDALQSLVASHWSGLLEALDAEQKEIAKSIVGEPVHWFRTAEENQFEGRDWTTGSYRATPAELAGYRTEDGRFPDAPHPVELKAIGIEYMHGHVHAMLRDRFIWDELEYSSDQRHEARKLPEILATNDHSLLRLDELLNQTVEYPKVMTSRLQPHQLCRFPSVEFQMLTARYRSSMGILHPVVAEFLKLTEPQKKRIAKNCVDFEKQSEELLKVITHGRKVAQEEFEKSATDLLTEKQKRDLAELVEFASPRCG